MLPHHLSYDSGRIADFLLVGGVCSTSCLEQTNNSCTVPGSAITAQLNTGNEPWKNGASELGI